MNNTVIDIDNVSFNYGVVPVLENVSLKIYEDEFIGIIGPNASGKSTLLKLILGLLEPDKGVIHKYNHAGKDLRNHIGYVPQHSSFPRDFPVTVSEVVMMGHIASSSRLFHYKNKEIELAKQVMQKLEIENIEKRQIGELSGGQLQRV